MPLPTQYFESVHSKPCPQNNMVCYRARYARSTMVLFSSKTHTPLAALIFHARDPGVLALLTGRPSPPAATEAYFQGLLNMPDQEFQFTIVNLNPSGFINFNILHTPHRVSEVDPGPAFGVNQINELHPEQAVSIQADQRTKRVMILSGLTKMGDSASPILVEDTEAKNHPDTPKGLNFYLSVVPELGVTTLCNRFAEGTVWKCVDHIIQSEPLHDVRKLHSQNLQDLQAASELSIPESAPGNGSENTLYRLQRGRGVRCTTNESAAGGVAAGGVATRGNTSKQFRGDDDGDGDEDGYGRVSMCFSEENDQDCLFSAPRQETANNLAFEPVQIGKTQAGRLSYGQEVQVASAETGKEYAYDLASTPTVLSLSLCPNLKFYPLPNLLEVWESEVKEWTENQGQRLIQALNAIYKNEECCIDLQSPADTIVYQCGHQCLNHANIHGLVKCPICRGHITALITADGQLL